MVDCNSVLCDISISVYLRVFRIMQFHSCNSPSNVVCQKMWYSLVIIFIFVQCGQGVVRHFNSKRHSEYIEYSFRRPGRPGVSDNDIQFDEIPQLRARRQGPFGEPISTSAFLQDGRSSARVIYSGEGSKVICLSTPRYSSLDYTLDIAMFYHGYYLIDPTCAFIIDITVVK